MATMAEPEAAGLPRRGRRRDPSIDRRVAEAVIELYARSGWNGLTVDEVARKARVGKAALYLRWPTKEALLVDAIAAVGVPVVPEPSGDIRADLLALARSLFRLYSTTAGIAYLRLYVEARYLPGLEQTWQQRTTVPRQLEARALVRGAVARGDLPVGTSPTILLDALAGAMANHVLSTPPELYQEMVAQAPAYLERLVDFVLAGARAAAPPGGGAAGAGDPVRPTG